MMRLGFLLLLSALLVSCGDADTDNATKAKKRPAQIHLVETVPVSLETISHQHTLSGSLRSRRSVRIFNQEEGQILSLALFEGDPVNTGQTLIKLDDRLLRREMDKALAEQHRAKALVTRLNRLSKSKLASEDELAEARKSLAVARASQQVLVTRLGFTTMTAPFSGVISQRLVEPGDVVPRYSHLLTISDPKSLISELSVSELLLPHLALNQAVGVQIDALGSVMHPGRILRIHPDVDPSSRRGIVEIALDPVPQGARAGQFCRINIETLAAERLLIPFSTLRRDREGLYVFRIVEQQAQRINIRTGLKFDHRIEVLAGLKPSDLVVVRGFMGLVDGKKVNVVNPQP